MAYQPVSSPEPSREDVDQLPGTVLLEFGAGWCPHCQAVQPLLQELLDAKSQVQHLKIEDGKGKPLGRSFRVTLWPTLIFLQQGRTVARLVRPSEAELREAFATSTSERAS